MPCHKLFIAHYEHALSDPQAFVEPLSRFLELDAPAREVCTCISQHKHAQHPSLQLLKKRLSKNSKAPSRKAHKLTQFAECKPAAGPALSEAQCYQRVDALMERFLADRRFMWPTFAGNGFDHNSASG